MLSETKPTIIVVPGAWHSPIHFSLLTALLESQSYPVLSQRHLSTGSENPTSQITSLDAEAIRDNLILPAINAGKDVVLIMHSYGGNAGSASARGLSKIERTREGKKGGVIGLLYMAALLTTGISFKDGVQDKKYPPWIIVKPNGQIEVDNPAAVFYDGVSAELTAIAVSNLLPQSDASASSSSTPPAWQEKEFDGRRVYLKTLQDKALPSFWQEMMIKDSGVEWDVQEIDAGHSPFLSHVEEVGSWVIGKVEKWAA